MVKDEVCGVLPYPHNFKTAPHCFKPPVRQKTSSLPIPFISHFILVFRDNDRAAVAILQHEYQQLAYHQKRQF